MPPRRPDALSLCMIVRDEERQLPKCLDSMRDLAGELIVVDTGSQDATARIAASYGADVIPFDFSVIDFAAARNCALARAHAPWILMLDADEILDRSGAPRLAELIARDENVGYFLERRNRWTGLPNSTVDYVVRLFRNRPDYRYRGRVHETIDSAILAGGGRLLRSGIAIDHEFSPDPQARRRKNRLYIEILKEEIAANPADHSRLDFLAAEYHQLEMFDEAAAIAERIAQVRPLDARAHLFAGVYHLLYKPDLARARADFAEALRLRPGYPEAESFLRTLAEREARSAKDAFPAPPSKGAT